MASNKCPVGVEDLMATHVSVIASANDSVPITTPSDGLTQVFAISRNARKNTYISSHIVNDSFILIALGL